MKIAFWGDPHIDKMKKLLGEEVSLKLSRKLLLAQLTETRKIGAKHAVILGDVFNDPFPTIDAMGLVIDVLSSADDIKFLVLLGNHDTYDPNTNSFKLLSKLPKAGALTNVKFITKATNLNWAKLRILALPFAAKWSTVDADLIVFHDQVVGAKMHKGPPVEIGKGIHPSKFQNCLAIGGDNHLQQHVGKNIYYPGVFAPMSFGESGPKYFAYLTTEDLKYHLYEIDPPWRLETIEWSNKNPPICNAPKTYYRLIVNDELPPPRWSIEHPQVVKTEGGSEAKRKNAASKIVSLIKGDNQNKETDSQLLNRWLKTFTPLDKLSRLQGIKIHDKFTD